MGRKRKKKKSFQQMLDYLNDQALMIKRVSREFFKKLYEIQLRKKLGDLISQYIKEIYIYDSYRYDNILNIADIFSHCYERFCKIEIFNKNRDFIMKTICEPIFGVKA